MHESWAVASPGGLAKLQQMRRQIRFTARARPFPGASAQRRLVYASGYECRLPLLETIRRTSESGTSRSVGANVGRSAACFGWIRCRRPPPPRGGSRVPTGRLPRGRHGVKGSSACGRWAASRGLGLDEG